MTLLHKLGIGLAVLGLLAGSYWYLINELNERSERIGQLEGEKQQLEQSLKDAEKATQQARAEMELWRGLYGDLQDDFEQIRENRAAMSEELARLREQENVQTYLECPMPDSLYDWVREN